MITYVTGEEGIKSESASFAIIVCSEDDENVLEGDYQGDSPDDEGECAEQVIITGITGKGGGINVKWAGTDITIDDTS